jgi:hypothetical protein
MIKKTKRKKKKKAIPTSMNPLSPLLEQFDQK